MFQSATIKLTAWYLLILMSISLLFSIIIYQITYSEVSSRLESLQLGIQEQSDLDLFLTPLEIRSLRADQAHEAQINLFVGLLYANVLILLAGGVGSYMLARRTLTPIEEALEAQSRFTSDASHELRTPLAVMKAELEVALRDNKLSASDMRELLESNLEEVDKLTELSHLLLQLSRLDYTALKMERVNLTDTITALSQRLDKNGKRFKLTMPKNAINIEGNQPGVEELLRILLDNAIKYSPPSSTITIDVKRKTAKAIISITNIGKGITPEALPFIFDRFYRADTSRTDSAKNGYGLGLAIAKKIVEIHNGDLSASSVIDGDTTLTVALPLHGNNIERMSEKFSK